MFEEADLIYRYTRAEAVADGVLIDVSPVAREAGITYPVALTCAAWDRCVAVPPGVECQDEAGRLWDVLWVLRPAIGRSGGGPEVRPHRNERNHHQECDAEGIECQLAQRRASPHVARPLFPPRAACPSGWSGSAIS